MSIFLSSLLDGLRTYGHWEIYFSLVFLWPLILSSSIRRGQVLGLISLPLFFFISAPIILGTSSHAAWIFSVKVLREQPGYYCGVLFLLAPTSVALTALALYGRRTFFNAAYVKGRRYVEMHYRWQMREYHRENKDEAPTDELLWLSFFRAEDERQNAYKYLFSLVIAFLFAPSGIAVLGIVSKLLYQHCRQNPAGAIGLVPAGSYILGLLALCGVVFLLVRLILELVYNVRSMGNLFCEGFSLNCSIDEPTTSGLTPTFPGVVIALHIIITLLALLPVFTYGVWISKQGGF